MQINKKYKKKFGMDGPFFYPNGQVLYFDWKEGEYYDPTTDLFLTEQEVNQLKMQLFNLIAS